MRGRSRLVRQGTALQLLLHHEVDVTLGADVVNDGDVGMIEGGGGAGFLLETSQPLGVGGVLLRQHLDGDITIQLRIPRPIHLSHAALTERFEDLVMTEGFADQDDGFLPGGVREQPTRNRSRCSMGDA